MAIRKKRAPRSKKAARASSPADSSTRAPSPRAALAEYRRKRDFSKTAEPSGAESAPPVRGGARFVVQKHAASHLHFDFRLEIGGTMKSWAVPKGPSYDPAVKRLAMEVEDHPISYNTFEGTIPRGQYGGGTVMLWDRGHFADANGGDDAALRRAHREGRLDLVLEGERLHGAWTLVRTRGTDEKPQWLLMKRSDAHAAPGSDIVAEVTTSVATGRTMEEIAAGGAPPKSRSGRVAKDASSGERAVKRSRASASASAGGPPPRSSSRRTAKPASPNARTTKPARARASAALPALEPMKASIGTAIPEGDAWTFEPKYDGIRVLAFATSEAVRLVTRNGNDKAGSFPEVAAALKALATRARRALVLDGEIVALVDGRPARFQALQGRMHVKDADAVAGHAEGTPASLVAFDVLVDGDDVLVREPWTVRRARLERILRSPLRGRHGERLLLGETESGDGERLVAHAREQGWEGVIAKRTDAPYLPGQRSAHWLKLKVEHRQEFVVGGWTEPRNTRQHLGALLLGHYDASGKLIYVGHAGGGFTHGGLAEMARRLAPLERTTSPFADKVVTNQRAHWARPSVVVEVKFIEWTADGRLRQPIVVGVRDDKAARDVTREGESVQDAPKTRSRKTATKPAPIAREGKAAARKASAKNAPAKKAPAKKAPAKKAPAKKAPAKTASAKKASAKSAPSASARKSTTKTSGGSVVAQLERIEAEGGDGTLSLGRDTTLKVTNLGKVYFPDDGYTKGDIMRFYAGMAKQVLPLVDGRPVVLRRFPGGITGQAFYQHVVDDPPPGVETASIDVDEDGVPKRYLVGGSLATLLYGVQLGAISIDPFHSHADALDTADYTIIDLDPMPKATFDRVVEVATWVKAELDALGLRAALKTSGSRGLHIALPLAKGTSAETALLLAQMVASRVAEKHPREATIVRAVKARQADAVYVDYLQNIPGKTVAGAYSVRARPGATVSTPLEWSELGPKLDPSKFTIRTVPDRVARLGDLWAKAMRSPNSKSGLAKAARG